MKSKQFLASLFSKITDDKRKVLSQGKVFSYVNPLVYLRLRKDRKLINGIDHFFLDGIVLVKIFSWCGIAKYKRISPDMTSLFCSLFTWGVEEEFSFYFVGSTPRSIESAIKNIKSKYKELNIVGYRSGFFENDEERISFLNRLQDLEPRYVIVGMGTPQQEVISAEIAHVSNKSTVITCGGFIHQTSESLTYYPAIIDRMNARWIYRIYREPKLVKRYLILYPISIILFSIDYLKYRIL